jgi:adenine-specific DNA-methyltransferase
MQAQDLIKRVAEYDKDLARDLQKFIGSRKLGLVYEESKPEYVRLWNKPVVEGDLVNILPPRGVAENLTDDADEYDAIWRVAQIADNIARLYKVESGELRDASLGDLVTVARFDQNIYCGLRETGRVERGGDKPYQVVINGENFHAIESLLFAYRGKVDCIYIDPPYNTGAKDWKYNNNYVGKDDKYRHSKWLTFMEDRLVIAKQLLNPTNSVLICTIDEKEYARLGLLLERLFPNATNLQMITCVTNPSGSSRATAFARGGEYIYVLMFGNERISKTNTDMLHGQVEEKDIAWEGYIRRGATRLRSDRPNMFYPIYFSNEDGSFVKFGDAVPLGIDYHSVPVPEGCFAVWPVVGTEERYWRLGKASSEKIYEQGFMKFGPWKKGRRKRAVYYLPSGTRKLIADGTLKIEGHDSEGAVIIKPAKKNVIPLDIWNCPSHSSADYGTPLLSRLIPKRRFPYPKSLYAVEDTLRFFLIEKPDALVVDFFAGSGTTAHAVMRLNHQDGGHRRCICVTNNEVSADEQKELVAKGLRQGDPGWERLGICEYVTKPRITAAITGETPDGKPIKGDYKFSDEFPMAVGLEENAVYYDLTYLEPSVVSADLAFDEIAPLLWMRAGSTGPMIRHGRTFELTDTYGVLFDIAYSAPFIRECRKRSIKSAFVVTDIDAEWRAICRELPGADVVQLYKHYLRSFEIGAGR